MKALLFMLASIAMLFPFQSVSAYSSEEKEVTAAKDTLIDFVDLNIAQAKPVDIPEAPLQPLKDEEVEKQSIIRALQSCGGVKTKAAQMLNVDSSTLYRKMKKYGIK